MSGRNGNLQCRHGAFAPGSPCPRCLQEIPEAQRLAFRCPLCAGEAFEMVTRGHIIYDRLDAGRVSLMVVQGLACLNVNPQGVRCPYSVAMDALPGAVTECEKKRSEEGTEEKS